MYVLGLEEVLRAEADSESLPLLLSRSRLCAALVTQDTWKEIHFFGDKCYPGGNDHEIFTSDATIGHEVTCPEDTIRELKALFKL